MKIAPKARVAVVIPAYNVRDYISETIESVLAQDFHDFVAVVVDDGSSDGTAEVVGEFYDSRLSLISLENSGGPARPRNTGILATDSEYVALLDGDDFWDPGKLSTAISVLDDCPDAGMACTDFRQVDEIGTVIRAPFLEPYRRFHEVLDELSAVRAYHLLPPEIAYSALCCSNFVGTSGVVIRRSVLDDVGVFDESLSNSDDRDLWFRISRKYGVAFIPAVMHSYRCRDGSISSSPSSDAVTARIRVLERQRDSAMDPGDRRELRARIGENYVHLGYLLRTMGERIESASAFLDALRYLHKPRLLLAAIKSCVSFSGRRVA